MSHSLRDQKAIKAAAKTLRKMRGKGPKKLAKRLAKIKSPKAKARVKYSQKAEFNKAQMNKGYEDTRMK
jgi:hypothetical protein